jgi:hypothetical protein
VRDRAAGVAFPRTSFSLQRTFICLVYSKFKLIKIKLKKVKYNFLLFLGTYKFNASYGTFSKIAAPSPGLPDPTQLLLRRYHGLRACIPGLQGTLVLTDVTVFASLFRQILGFCLKLDENYFLPYYFQFIIQYYLRPDGI